LDCHFGSSVWIYKLLHVVGRLLTAVKVINFADRFVWPQSGNLKTASCSGWRPLSGFL